MKFMTLLAALASALGIVVMTDSWHVHPTEPLWLALWGVALLSVPPVVRIVRGLRRPKHVSADVEVASAAQLGAAQLETVGG